MEKILVENCYRYYIWEIMKRYSLTSRDLLKQERLGFWTNNSHFETNLSFSKTNFNGQRAWFKCPLCSRRRGCLYQPYKANSLLCRDCLEAKYSFQSLHKDLWWELIGKHEHKQAKIRKKLENRYLRKPQKMKLVKQLKDNG
ncbi:hypothetical protein ACFL2I_04650 [Candidatus Omnitrophota bacterium]